jgi:hypothetical protein
MRGTEGIHVTRDIERHFKEQRKREKSQAVFSFFTGHRWRARLHGS